MALLLNGQELCACDIMAALNLPQSTVPRHLSYLRNAGLIDDRRKGVWMYYKITLERFKHAASIFDLLGKILPELDQTGDDQENLKKHLAAKGENPCN